MSAAMVCITVVAFVLVLLAGAYYASSVMTARHNAAIWASFLAGTGFATNHAIELAETLTTAGEHEDASALQQWACKLTEQVAHLGGPR